MRRRWEALTRGEQAVMAALAALLVVGIALRVTVMVIRGPGFLGYADSYVYMDAARDDLFGPPIWPAGYPLFLRVAHWVSPTLSFVIGLQHLLGVATALLLFSTVRRVAPAGWGLIPAAVVLLAGPQIMLEHAPLSEAFFAFLLAGICYCATRAVTDGPMPWGWLAGGLAAMAACVRSVGLVFPVVVVVCLVAGTRGGWRPRLVAGAAAAAAAWFLLAGYVISAKHEAGYVGPGLTRAGGWNLYARVGPFADCKQFTPPPDARKLCERRPPERRPSVRHYALLDSPASRAYGGWAELRPKQNDTLSAFARAAILHQPGDYLSDVSTDVSRLWRSTDHSTGYPGETYDSMVRYLIRLWRLNGVLTTEWYSTAGDLDRALASAGVRSYVRHTRFEGLPFVLLAALALAGIPFARGLRLTVGLLVLTVAATAVIAPIAFLTFDVRFVVPGYGPVAAAGAIGAATLWERVAGRARRRERVHAGAGGVA
jgi:4-amino-4-deoxy-L-arabinose transferase-like glycosyltransferase